MGNKNLYEICKEQENIAVSDLSSGTYGSYIEYIQLLIFYLDNNMIDFPQYQHLLSSLMKRVNFDDINNYYKRRLKQ